MDIRYFIDPETGLPHIYHHDITEEDVADVLGCPSRIAPGEKARVSHSLPARLEGAEGPSSPAEEEAMKEARYPVGWDEERVRRVLEHYEAQSDEEAVAEDEAAQEANTATMMQVPVDLVPVVRELIAKRSAE